MHIIADEIADEATGVNAVINKGGSVPAARAHNGAKEQVVLRIPSDILEGIDQAVAGRRVPTPRHTWIIEALVEKLEREGDGR